MRHAAHNTAKQSAARRIHGVVLLGVLALLSTASPHAFAQNSAAEYQVKAAFVFHFAQLVDWPSETSDAPEQSITLCLFDDGTHNRDFRSTLQGKTLGARAFSVRELHKVQDAQGCDILFLTREEIRRQRELLAGLKGQPVLTIGETDSFLKDGGMVRFRLEGDKIRFDINLAAAENARLRISSRLLLLASRIFRGSVEMQGGM